MNQLCRRTEHQAPSTRRSYCRFSLSHCLRPDPQPSRLGGEPAVRETCQAHAAPGTVSQTDRVAKRAYRLAMAGNNELPALVTSVQPMLRQPTETKPLDASSRISNQPPLFVNEAKPKTISWAASPSTLPMAGCVSPSWLS